MLGYCWQTIFVVLHPSHKLAYFIQASWDNAWHATAEEIVQTEFEWAYADLEVMDSQNMENVCQPFPIWMYYTDLHVLDGQHHYVQQHLWYIIHTFSTFEGGISWWADTLSGSTSREDLWSPSVVGQEAHTLSMPLLDGLWLSLHSWYVCFTWNSMYSI